VGQLYDGSWRKTPCIEAHGYRNKQGYCVKRYNGKRWFSHRLAWYLEFGPIPDGVLVCHKCDNPSCINTGHLFLGSPKDNTADRDYKGRHKCGHQKGEENSSSKLTEDVVRLIRERVNNGESKSSVARSAGISCGHVCRIVSRENWAHVP